MSPTTDTTEPKREESAPVSVTVVREAPTKPQGIVGTTNYGGDLYAESNAKLTFESAYGVPGSRTWGEWEALIRTDSAAAAGLDFVAGPIRDAQVEVNPAEDAPNGQTIADFVRWNLLEQLEPTFPEFLTQCVRETLGIGFALFEPTFKQVQHKLLPGGRGLAIATLPQRLPSTLVHNAWLEDPTTGDLRAVHQQGPDSQGVWRSLDIPAENLLLLTWQRTGNNYAGFSAFRPGWYIAKIRAELLRLVGVTYQREGAGVPVMEATDKSAELTPEQREQMETLLANLVYHENASLVPPAGWSLKWTFSAGANKGHVLDAWHRLGVALLELVQAQQLALGTGDTGSRSVGEVHDASARAYIASVAALIEGALNGVGSRKYTGLIRRLVDANFGPQASYPTVKLTLKQAQLSPDKLLDAVTKGASAGAITITAKDENVIRERLGMPPIDEGERKVELERRASLAPKAVEDEASAEDEKENANETRKARLQASAPKATKPWMPWRPLRASEAKLDLVGMDRFLASRPEVFEQDARPVIVEMLTRAAPAITKAMADGVVTPAEVAGIPLDETRLRRLVDGFVLDVASEGARTVKRELRDDDAEQLLEQRRMEAAEEEDDFEPDPVIDALKDQVRRRMVSRLRAEVERSAIDVMRRNGDASDVVTQTIFRQLETGAFRQDAGSVTTKAFVLGREQAAERLGGVASVEYSAILDNSTCAVCRSMDGRSAPFESDAHIEMIPPNVDCEGGDRCRCLLVYLPGTQDNEGGDDEA